MSNFPRLHKREQIVREAELKLRQAMLDIWKESDLTDAEMLRIVAACFGDHVAGHAKYDIRMERHGNTDTPGGWE